MISLDKTDVATIKPLRLVRVKVEKLFGIFDHDIELDKKTGITIVIGENGLGKTVVLESIKSFFDGKNNFLRICISINSHSLLIIKKLGF